MKDGVRISSEAQQAADIGRLLRLSEEQAEIRADRVVEAKEGLERGDYKDMNVLREVARNLLKYIE